MRRRYLACLAVPIAILIIEGCGGSNSASIAPSDGGSDSGPRGTESVGQTCKVPTECYPDLDGGAIKGTLQCLTKVPNGYCTHLCTKDADCCATAGECKTGFKQVCAPFENQGQMMCFLSCEDADLHAVPDAGADAATDAASDSTAYCQSYASAVFGCRSTGGGSKNRKVCLP